MSSKRSLGLRAAALLGAAGIALAACGSSSHSGQGGGAPGTSANTGPAATSPPPPGVSGTLSGPGVTATTITIGQITTTSGPVPG